MNKRNTILAILLAISVLFTISSKSTSALSLDGIVDGVKDMFTDKEDKNVKKKDFTIESDISLAPNGDVNKNKLIDAGDIVTFTYTLSNATDNSFAYATLRTNINRNQISFIHSVRGATGISDEEKTITFKNIRINAHEQREISFDARIIYSREDKTIATTPEFLSSDEKSIVKSNKLEIVAKKLDEKELQERIKFRKAAKVFKKE